MGKVFIIAEAGVNHNGNIAIAKKLIDKAAACGADAVKFQTFKAEKIISRFAPKAEYQKKTTRRDESQLEMVKKYELDAEAHGELIRHCRSKGIKFLSSQFDPESIDLLKKLDLSIFKIPSGEIVNLPYLRKIGSLRKKIFLSTGMADLREIETALKVLTNAGTLRKNITVLHCHTEYPTRFEDVNLRAMVTIAEKLKVSVGYSDHTLGIEVPIAAVALGASVIEKHFTLAKNMQGPDHKASLEPGEFQQMAEAIRKVEAALGSSIKKPTAAEQKNKNIVRKSIVAARDIYLGEFFSETNLAIKRPGSGISPMQWDVVLGKKAKRNFQEDELIRL